MEEEKLVCKHSRLGFQLTLPTLKSGSKDTDVIFATLGKGYKKQGKNLSKTAHDLPKNFNLKLFSNLTYGLSTKTS